MTIAISERSQTDIEGGNSMWRPNTPDVLIKSIPMLSNNK